MRKYQAKPKVALVYDRVNKWGGAERVLLTLHEMFPEAPLYTSLYNPETAKWAGVFDVRPSFLNKVKIFRTRHEWLAPIMPLVFESFNFSDYDLVISVTSESAKGIVTSDGTKHVCICLTPTRYLWSHYKTYFNFVWRIIYWPFIKYLRWWDRAAAQRSDVVIGISTEVCARIKKYYDREAELIFPPVELGLKHKSYLSQKNPFFGGSKNRRVASRQFLDINVEKYYLVVSRLVKYKKVDLVVEAFNDLPDKRLIIIGGGKEEGRLKDMASDNVMFLKDVPDGELVEYYKNTTALIVPQWEDFGLTMVEAMSFGVPVIAFDRGGSRDIVSEGLNGVFFDSQRKADIIEAVRRFESLKFDKMKIVKSIRRFSKEEFKDKINKIISI